MGIDLIMVDDKKEYSFEDKEVKDSKFSLHSQIKRVMGSCFNYLDLLRKNKIRLHGEDKLTVNNSLIKLSSECYSLLDKYYSDLEKGNFISNAFGLGSSLLSSYQSKLRSLRKEVWDLKVKYFLGK